MHEQLITKGTSARAAAPPAPQVSSLERFRGRQLVVRAPDESVSEAAREMASRRIGLILVEEESRLVGVLTDRDIAIRVVAERRDPEQTSIRSVMTAVPATLPIAGSFDDALSLMRVSGVRRIPLVEGGRAVGLVMMDDLIANENVDRRAVAAVARAQLDAAGARPAELSRVIRLVRDATELETPARALSALEVIVSSLVRRLALRDASQLLAQLPIELRERLLQLPARSERAVTRETVEAELVRRLAIEPVRASRVVDGVGLALRRLVGASALAELRDHLPVPLRGILSDALRRP